MASVHYSSIEFQMEFHDFASYKLMDYYTYLINSVLYFKWCLHAHNIASTDDSLLNSRNVSECIIHSWGFCVEKARGLCIKITEQLQLLIVGSKFPSQAVYAILMTVRSLLNSVIQI